MSTTSTRGVEVSAIDNSDIHQVVCRLIVDGKHIRYAVIENEDFGVRPPGLLYSEDESHMPFPPLPPAEKWSVGQIVKDKETGKPRFVVASEAKYEWIQLKGVTNAWHPTYIDYFDKDLKTVHRAVKSPQQLGCDDRLRLVTHPKLFGGTRPVLMKTYNFPVQCVDIEAEILAYHLLENKGIAPDFLGQVTAEGQVIGFFIEYVSNEDDDDDDNHGGRRSKHPGLADIERCTEALSRLHSFGVVHNDAHAGNILRRRNPVTGDPEFIFIDFEMAQFTTNDSARQRDTKLMVERLQGRQEVDGFVWVKKA